MTAPTTNQNATTTAAGGQAGQASQNSQPKKPRASRKNTSVTQQAVPEHGKAANHSILAAEATAAAGTVAHFTGGPAWWGAIGLVGAISATASTQSRFALNRTITDSETGKNYKRREMDPNAGFAAATTTAAGSYATCCAADLFTPWSVEGIGLLGITAAALGPVYSYLRARNDKQNAAQVAKLIEQKNERQRDNWETILKEAGIDDVTIATHVTDDDWAEGKRTFPAGFALLLKLGKKSPKAKELSSFIGDIERIAENITDMPFFSGSIEFTNIPGRSSLAEIRVATKDVLRETMHAPELDLDNPRSINDGIRLGQQIDGTEMVLDLNKNPHGIIAGQTDTGKTVFYNQHACETIGMPDASTWMIAGNKPSRILVPWLLPFFNGHTNPTTGEPCDPAVDWVAGTWDEAVRMLLDAYKAIDVRQASAMETGEDKWTPKPGSPRICILIDESPDLLQDERHVGTTHRGEKGLTFSELLLKVIRLGRSEGISVIFLTQRATNTMIGNDGGDLRSQLAYRAALRIKGNHADANAVFSTDTHHIDLSELDVGQVYVEMAGMDAPVRMKSYLNDPSMIMDRARRASHLCGPIDDYTADELDYYPTRWTRSEQVEFFKQHLCPNPVRTNPATPLTPQQRADGAMAEAAQTGDSILDRPDADGDPDTAGELWWRDLGEEEFTAMLSTLGFDPNDGDPGDSRIRAGLETMQLEEIWSLPEAAEPNVAPEPSGPRFNPQLPEDTQLVLATLESSVPMVSGYNLITTQEIARLMHQAHGWPQETVVSGNRIKEALKWVSVSSTGKKEQVRDADGKPLHFDNGSRMRLKGYWVEDIQAAIDMQRIDTDTDIDE